ncbi:Annexin [Macleaya cordata]|uniref:Annexin n=1 Tax=Macleaya cordata TaxID=56857 RepID=A0A200QG11_MACCD|nr:Annexin [Macleaya cordata]
MATLVVHDPAPSPLEDAQNIRKAVEGWGTNEKGLIAILGHRNAAQRKSIRLAYEEHYHEDLIKRLEHELSGDFEKAMYRWILDPRERDAVLANVALRHALPDYRVLIEIACVYSPDELLAVKRAYQCRYKRSLEEDVASHTSGDFRKACTKISSTLLFALVSTYRYDGIEINEHLAISESKILHELIDKKAFSDDELIRILSTRSKEQLNATFNRYKDDHKTSATKSLLGDPADEFLAALRTVIRCISSPMKYFEKVLRNALSHPGTDEDALTRVIVTHAGKDLKEIKEIYYKRNNVTLDNAVAKDTSGDYKVFLLALLGNEGH